ncbi:MAG: DUF2283 domain-containing protein [Armatimonadetes bacterium]|nr:DUF2283 domain-containing protein [Armatimonadota bacterium]
MKLRYNREEDILTIEIAGEGKVDHAEHSGPFIAHLSPEGKLLLLEILDASEFLSSLVRVSLRGTEEELPSPLS